MNINQLMFELRNLTHEYIEKGGGVTCELSLESLTEELGHALIELNTLLEPLDAFWCASPCGTCVSHDETTPWHLEIKKHKYIC